MFSTVLTVITILWILGLLALLALGDRGLGRRAATLDDAPPLGELASIGARALKEGDPGRAAGLLATAAQGALGREELDVAARYAHQAADAFLAVGDHVRAIQALHACIPLARRRESFEHLAGLHHHKAQVMASHGNLRLSLGYHLKAARLAARSDPPLRAFAQRPDEVLEVAVRWVDELRQTASDHRAAGRIAQARECLIEAREALRLDLVEGAASRVDRGVLLRLEQEIRRDLEAVGIPSPAPAQEEPSDDTDWSAILPPGPAN